MSDLDPGIEKLSEKPGPGTRESINNVHLICSFLLPTTDNPIWQNRVKNGSGELWEFAFGRLIHQDKLITRGLMPSDTISVESKAKWFPNEENLLVKLNRISAENYSLSIYRDYVIKAKILFGEGDIILEIDRELATNPIERQKLLILAMLTLRKELESTR
ncbi:hypothetical protein JW796_04595 [Candidatus Dojkabacteria bacterium]|nr:hypothetical protein [Candidatus Dojkabacteria bacterium]